MKDIGAIIAKIEGLTPIPQVANKVMDIAKNPRSSASQLAGVLLYDPSLTANLLRTCNSAYFGLSRQVDSVQQAIVYLGMNQVVDIVLMSGGKKNFSRRQEGYDLDEGELWKCAVSSALIARDLAKKKGSGKNHVLFTAALLKDIGKVILSQHVAESFERINALVSEAGYSFREAEKKVIGIDHAELGAMVAEKWNFSPRLVSLIRNHHLSEESSEADFETSIIHLADIVCMMMGIGVGSDGLAYRFHRKAMDTLGFSAREIQEIMAGFAGKLQHVEELIRLH